MISIYTRPGTEVMCIATFRSDEKQKTPLPGVTAGRIYIVCGIELALAGEATDFAVFLAGHGVGERVVYGPWYAPWRRSIKRFGYSPKLFRYLTTDHADNARAAPADLRVAAANIARDFFEEGKRR